MTAYDVRISDWSSDVCSSDLRILGIDGVVLATFASVCFVWSRHFQHHDAIGLKVTQQSGAVASRAFHSNAFDSAERAHPGDHLLIPMPGRRDTLTAQHNIVFLHACGNMKILVRLNASVDRSEERCDGKECALPC